MVARKLPMLLLLLACSNGMVVRLGEREPEKKPDASAASTPNTPNTSSGPQLISELASPGKSDNPTLTADLLEIFFTSDRAGGLSDIWTAARTTPTSKFDTPRPVTELNTQGTETSSAISADGLTLWFGSDRAGGIGDYDIWVSTRASRNASWSAPVNVSALNSSAKDIPRPPGFHERIMALASDRRALGTYDTFLAERSSKASTFGTPALLSELTFPGMTTVDAWLSDDGLLLLYSMGNPLGPTDLFVARRASTSETFAAGTALSAIDTADDERDPWLSPDGTQLYFAATRGGHLQIYVADVTGMF